MQGGLFSNQRETTSERERGKQGERKHKGFLSPHHIV